MRRLIGSISVLALVLVAPALGRPPASSSATLSASSSQLVIGSSTLLSGKVSGKKAAGAKVDLQAAPFPYTSFSTVASTAADAAGDFHFQEAPGINTEYRAVAKVAPSATSLTVLVKVRVKVTLHVGTTKPAVGTMVRFSGYLLPAYNGRFVLIQRKTATGWKTVAQARLVASTPLGTTSRSRYSKRIRFRKRGSYRVWFNPADNARLPNSSPTRILT